MGDSVELLEPATDDSTIEENISRISDAKNSIRQAIIDKGVPVSAKLRIDEYADKIAQISGGGSSIQDIMQLSYSSDTHMAVWGMPTEDALKLRSMGYQYITIDTHFTYAPIDASSPAYVHCVVNDGVTSIDTQYTYGDDSSEITFTKYIALADIPDINRTQEVAIQVVAYSNSIINEFSTRVLIRGNSPISQPTTISN